MNSQAIFTPRLLIGWIAAAVLTFGFSLYFMTQGDSGKSGTDAIGPTTFSRSAIGHAGMAEILRRLGTPVVKSQYDSLGKLGTDSVLVIAEPRFTAAVGDTLPPLLAAKNVLLVLPKWQGSPSDTRPGWIGSAEPISATEATAILNIVVQAGEVLRPDAIESWTTNALGPIPDLVAPAQLLRSSRVRPIVAAADGILVGEFREKGRRLWVLADPDVMENHGIASGDNAAFSVALIKALRSGDGSVVFDETVHGYIARPASPLKLLVQFPFVFGTIQGVLAVLLLLWATAMRFGAPETAPPALSVGKQSLIGNAAKLLEFAGYQRAMIRRYVQATIRDVAYRLHAPRGLSDGELVEWLQRVGQARAVSVDCGDAYGRAGAISDGRRGDPSPLIPIARDIHQWKREIIDGSARRTRGH